jgi:hypothetical protein
MPFSGVISSQLILSAGSSPTDRIDSCHSCSPLKASISSALAGPVHRTDWESGRRDARPVHSAIAAARTSNPRSRLEAVRVVCPSDTLAQRAGVTRLLRTSQNLGLLPKRMYNTVVVDSHGVSCHFLCHRLTSGHPALATEVLRALLSEPNHSLRSASFMRCFCSTPGEL